MDKPSDASQAAAMYAAEYHKCRAELATMTKAKEEAEREAVEQARLNGMGAERELALQARLKEAERERDEARGLLRAFNKVRRCDHRSPLLVTIKAYVEKIDRASAKE